MTTILYPEAAFADATFERSLFGPDVEVIRRDVGQMAELGLSGAGFLGDPPPVEPRRRREQRQCFLPGKRHDKGQPARCAL